MKSLNTQDTTVNNHRAKMYGTNDLFTLRSMVAGKSKTEVLQKLAERDQFEIIDNSPPTLAEAETIIKEAGMDFDKFSERLDKDIARAKERLLAQGRNHPSRPLYVPVPEKRND